MTKCHYYHCQLAYQLQVEVEWTWKKLEVVSLWRLTGTWSSVRSAVMCLQVSRQTWPNLAESSWDLRLVLIFRCVSVSAYCLMVTNLTCTSAMWLWVTRSVCSSVHWGGSEAITKFIPNYYSSTMKSLANLFSTDGPLLDESVLDDIKALWNMLTLLAKLQPILPRASLKPPPTPTDIQSKECKVLSALATVLDMRKSLW